MVKDQVERGTSVYRLIIMDYKMPKLKGIEAAAMIRNFLCERAPEQPRPFIVCLSSYCRELPIDVKQGDGNIVDLILNKPIFKPGIFMILEMANILQENDQWRSGLPRSQSIHLNYL